MGIVGAQSPDNDVVGADDVERRGVAVAVEKLYPVRSTQYAGDLRPRGRPPRAERNRLAVPDGDRHAHGRGRDAQIWKFEYLLQLRSDLPFFVGVAVRIERTVLWYDAPCDAARQRLNLLRSRALCAIFVERGSPGARDALIGSDARPDESKFLRDRCKRQRKRDRGAVGVCDEAGADRPCSIDLRHDERHALVESERGRFVDHERAARSRCARIRRARRGSGGEKRDIDARQVAGAGEFAHRPRFAKRRARGTPRPSACEQCELRRFEAALFQRRQERLTDQSGRTDDRDARAALHSSSPIPSTKRLRPRAARTAIRMPGTNDAREDESCTIASVSPSPPKRTSWCVITPGSRKL